MAAASSPLAVTDPDTSWSPPKPLAPVPRALWIMARLCPSHEKHVWPLTAVASKVVHAALKDVDAVDFVIPIFAAFETDIGKKPLSERKRQLVSRLERYSHAALGAGATSIGRSLSGGRLSTPSPSLGLEARFADDGSDSPRSAGTGSMGVPSDVRESIHAAKGSVTPVKAARLLSRGRLGAAGGSGAGLIVYSFRTMHRLAADLVRVANGQALADRPSVSAASAGGAVARAGIARAHARASSGDGGMSVEMPVEGNAAMREAHWDRFPDGWPNITLDRVKDGRYNSVALILDLRNPETLFEQLCVLYTLPKEGILRLTVVIPFFPGQSDRAERSGEVPTAWVLARLISTLPPCATGPPQLVILDIHALQERHFFGDAVQVRLRSCVGQLRERLLRSPDSANLAIAWPDDGAAKRFSSHFRRCGQDVFPLVICHKRREGDRRVVRIAEGDPRGKVVCIVDDLVQTGGTLMQCAEALLAAGAVRVMAYVTHAVFPGGTWGRFVAEPRVIDPFFVTDTIPEMADQLRGKAPFQVLSIAPVLADLLGLDETE